MYLRLKRAIDIIGSAVGLIIFFPLLMVISILVLIYHGKPVLFSQKRPGRNELIFNIYKFRTMTNTKDENGNLLPDGDRITPFGRFLRKTSLDELPELYNVLIGDMSLVGPRPLLVNYLPHYTEKEKVRHSVRPGITGLAQVSGRNFIDWDSRLSLDVEYVENISFVIDIKILCKTIANVITSKDISANTADIEPSLVDCRTKLKS
jgi:undecaprenyl phosphate N,N'-diacetylbacillosamine 1-phosphate transferase